MFQHNSKRAKSHFSRGFSALISFSMLFSSALPAADKDDVNPDSVTHQMWRKIRLGELKIEGDHGAVEALVLQGNIPITSNISPP